MVFTGIGAAVILLASGRLSFVNSELSSINLPITITLIDTGQTIDAFETQTSILNGKLRI